MLTAAWQFDCCKLFFVVFLKCWPKLRYEARTFDCEGFDIYSSRLSIDGALRGIASVPAITSASLLEVRDKLLVWHMNDLPLLGVLLPQRRRPWLNEKPFQVVLGGLFSRDYFMSLYSELRWGCEVETPFSCRLPLHMADAFKVEALTWLASNNIRGVKGK